MRNHSEYVVELYYATIPGLVGFFAAHYWFEVHHNKRQLRYEVWHQPNKSKQSFGHVHCNLLTSKAGVGGGPSILETVWGGNEAARIAKVLKKVKEYPFCEVYRYWPGPNSNTFVVWVLREARVAYSLGRLAVGKDYPLP